MKKCMKFLKYFWLYIKQTLRFVLKPMSFLPAILIMCFIFYMSAQPDTESSMESSRTGVFIFTTVSNSLDLGWSADKIQELSVKYEHPIRKAAHMTEYCLLAISVAIPLYVYGLRGIPLIFVAGLFCIGYAASDEYHQTFVQGRSGNIKDVCIDSIGAIIGVFLARILGFIGRTTIFRPLANKKVDKRV